LVYVSTFWYVVPSKIWQPWFTPIFPGNSNGEIQENVLRNENKDCCNIEEIHENNILFNFILSQPKMANTKITKLALLHWAKEIIFAAKFIPIF
jgi:hypothetical protein